MLVSLLSLIGLVILLVIAFYIPPIQDAVLNKVAKELSKGENGIKIEYDKLRIHFPTHLEGKNLHVLLPGDIEAGIGYVDANIKLLPLLKTDISSDRIDIEKANFRLGSPDSSLYLIARIDTFSVDDISVDLKKTRINLKEGDVNGVDVSLLIKESDEEKEDTTKTTGDSFVIDAGLLKMHDVKYFMSIEPIIDTIAAYIPETEVSSINVDLNTHKILASEFKSEGVKAKYIYPPSEKSDEKKEEKVEDIPIEEPDSLPWTIRVNRIQLNAETALYAENGYTPTEGFDARYIEAKEIEIKVDSFYNCLQDITVPVERISAVERCGLRLTGTGTFSIAESMMRASKFEFLTPGSKINLNASMGLESEKYPTPDKTPVSLQLNADIFPGDVVKVLPSLGPILDNLPPATPLIADIDMIGNMNDIVLNDFILELPHYLEITAQGDIAGFSLGEPQDLEGNIKLKGQLLSTKFLKPSVIEAKLGKGIHVVPFSIGGDIDIRNGLMTADIRAKAEGGRLGLDGKLRMNAENYDLTLNSTEFPVQSFMPGLGISDVTMNLTASGHPFNPMKKGASLDANIDIEKLIYEQSEINSLSASANINGGNAKIDIKGGMDAADFEIHADGNLLGKVYKWNLDGNIRNLELSELGLTKTDNGGSLIFDGEGTLDTDSMFVDAHLDFPYINWTLDDREVMTTNLSMHFNASKNNTDFTLTDRDMTLDISSPSSLDSIMTRVPRLTAAIDSCMKDQRLDIVRVQEELPEFTISLHAKNRNIISEWMADRGDYFDSLGIDVVNKDRISIKALLKNYDTPKYIIDTLSADIYQVSDSLRFNFNLINSPESPGDWAEVKLWGRLGGNEVDVRFNQKNHEGKTGMLIGFDAQYADSTATLTFKPTNPIIGYRNWTINKDNFISVDFANKHLDADLSIISGSSSLRLYTDHIEGVNEQEEINLVLRDIEIADWVSLNPFATPMKGLLSGKISLSHEDKIFNGNGFINLKDFTYGKKRVGTFDLGLDVSTKPGGFIHAGANVSVDSLKVLSLYGVLNDTTANDPFKLEMTIDSLPLAIANPFLAEGGISLSGRLDGEMKVTGEPTSPVFNGFIDFYKAGITVRMLGTTYTLSDKKIPVDTGIVRFVDYDITAVNDNPLYVNGTVNMRDIFNPAIDLSLKASNIQLIGTDRARGGAELYGKAFADLDATAKGNLKFMNINAKADLLNTTNVTYVMVGGAQSALTSRSNSNLVKFVNFADTSMVADADTIKPTGMLMRINALLTISRGAQIAVDLSSDGKNKVQLEPSGDLDYTMDLLGGQHLTGRLNIDDGFARYTPPLMSEKLFTFQEGSYVDFNGNISNPILNIHAVDRVKANVTQEGQNSRLIYFNVGLDITGTLENMDVAFNLSTDDDVTVANELESMSPSQRASKAMNLLLTNIYNGPGTTADANMGANALYSFLSSTLNSWAANNIKGVDLTFGVNQYENTTDGVSTQATSYSYNVSKSLLNDRFKINIGGNYTTDADPNQNLTQNLISDISIEYILNKSGSMYIKIFRHTGFESILEGEIVQTGVGITYRKKLNSLKQMFHFLYRKHKKNEEETANDEPSNKDEVQLKSSDVTK